MLENGEVVRLGSNEPIKVDVRLISATNRKLDEMVAEKQFREDLFFRIKGVTLVLPPLRERREDIPLLIHYFLQEFAAKYNEEIDGISPEAQQMLMALWLAGQHPAASDGDREHGGAVAGQNARAGDRCRRKFSRGAGAPSRSGGMNNLVGISIEQAEKELIRNTLKMVDGQSRTGGQDPWASANGRSIERSGNTNCELNMKSSR